MWSSETVALRRSVRQGAPTDAERELVVFLLGGTVRSASDWITSLVASGQRPWEEVIDSSELVDGGSPAEEEGR